MTGSLPEMPASLAGGCSDMLTHAKSMLISPPDVAIDPPYTPEKNAALMQWFDY